MKYGRRIFFFILTNIMVLVTLSIAFTVLTRLFGIEPFMSKNGINHTSLMIFSAVWGFGGAFISLLMSRWMAKTMMRVQVIDPKTAHGEAKWLLDRVYQISETAGLKKMPEVGIYDSPELNAFATGPGRNKSLVAVSSGLLNRMNRDQIEGVLAHEVGHIANGDMVTMTLIQGVVNAFVLFFARVVAYTVGQNVRGEMRWMVQFAVIIVMEIIFGILGSMVVAFFSRKREFRADEAGAILAGKEKMISALEGLKANMQIQPAMAQASGKEANQFQSLKIFGKKGFMGLFSTHPDLDIRIQALRKMETDS